MFEKRIVFDRFCSTRHTSQNQSHLPEHSSGLAPEKQGNTPAVTGEILRDTSRVTVESSLGTPTILLVTPKNYRTPSPPPLSSLLPKLAVTPRKITRHAAHMSGHTPPNYWSHTQVGGHNKRTTNNNNCNKLNAKKNNGNSNKDSENNICSGSLHPGGQRGRQRHVQRPQHQRAFQHLSAAASRRQLHQPQHRKPTTTAAMDNCDFANHKAPTTARAAPATARQTKRHKQARKTNSSLTFSKKKCGNDCGPGGSADRCSPRNE